MVINLEEYRMTKAAKPVELRRYDEEQLCVNWNPAIGVIAMSCYQTEQELSPQLPDDFAYVDVGAFLDRVYALASQI